MKLFGWRPIVHKNFWDEKKDAKPFIHLPLGKAGPFALESHIHVKALKMQGLPNNYINAL